MKIILKGKDFEITDSVEDYLRKTIKSLEKLFKNYDEELMKVEMEVGRTTRHHQTGDIFRAEINLSVGGKLFRAESERDDIFAAIDEVRDDLEREIKKFKTKNETISIRGARSFAKQFKISPLARFKK